MCGQARHGQRRYETRAQSDPDLRASDAERERVAQLLRDSAGEGRLDMDELDERLERVYAARTHGELQRVTRDLPAPPRSRELVSERRTRVPTTFVWISALLIAIWVLTGFGYFWPVWPMLWFAFATLRHRRHYRRRYV
jgi:hypothetical protein